MRYIFDILLGLLLAMINYKLILEMTAQFSIQ